VRAEEGDPIALLHAVVVAEATGEVGDAAEVLRVRRAKLTALADTDEVLHLAERGRTLEERAEVGRPVLHHLHALAPHDRLLEFEGAARSEEVLLHGDQGWVRERHE